MLVLTLIKKYPLLRQIYLRGKPQSLLIYKISLSLSFASLTGLAAQISFPLPWTPVPITGQTFVVLLSSLILGKWLGGLSQLLYIGIGICGIPWFTGGNTGFSYLAGPTGGYLIGFIFAAFFLGYIKNISKSPGFILLIFYLLLANFLFIHGIGLIQLYLWLNIFGTNPLGIKELTSMGTLPFIPSDILKIIAVATMAKTVTLCQEKFSNK